MQIHRLVIKITDAKKDKKHKYSKEQEVNEEYLVVVKFV